MTGVRKLHLEDALALASGLRDTATWIRSKDPLATNWLYCVQAADALEALSVREKVLVEALEFIRDWSPREFMFPADWSEQIENCAECESYKCHPIQQGICNTHRRALWDREAHDNQQRELRGLYARDYARVALAGSQSPSTGEGK